MSLNKVPSGRDLPNDFNVIIEIPMNADPVKYEVDKESGAIFVDRFMGTAMHYPCNYGYVPHTIADDGDPLDRCHRETGRGTPIEDRHRAPSGTTESPGPSS